MDANVLGKVCENDTKAREVLEGIRNHQIYYCTKIFKEYKAIPNLSCCRKNKNNMVIVREWLIGLTDKYGKKIQIDDTINNKCLKRLIRRNKFNYKDCFYIKVAQRTDDRLLIAFEWHFVQADKCILELGICRLDLDGAIKLMEKKKN
jgi:hypothetical protein